MQGGANPLAIPLSVAFPDRLAVAAPIDPAQLSAQPCPQRQSKRFCDAFADADADQVTLELA